MPVVLHTVKLNINNPILPLGNRVFLEATHLLLNRIINMLRRNLKCMCFAFAGLLVAGFGACGPSAPRNSAVKSPPSVILISLDTTRADLFGILSGEQPSLTPRFDEFGADAVIFENAFVQAPHTLPSHMSMFTAVYPDVHQVKPEQNPLPEDFHTLPQILSDAGYATTGLFTSEWLKPDFGFGRGFDYYRQVPHDLYYADRVNAAALERLNHDLGARPFFLFLHYYDLHSDFDQGARRNKFPYYAPESYREDLGIEVSQDGAEFCTESGECNTRYLMAMDRERRKLPESKISIIHDLYRAAMPLLDAQMGDFFDALKQRGLYDDTLIVITSDHGEEFREHGRFIHSQPYDETIQVPLFIKFPEQWKAGIRISEIAETVDILPTLLEFLDLPAPDYIQGTSMMGLVTDTGQQDKEFVASQDTINRARYGIRTNEIKFIMDLKSSRRELYDLTEDPQELNNLTESHEQLAAEMETRLKSLVRRNRGLGSEFGSALKTDSEDILSPEEQERLKALGYLN